MRFGRYLEGSRSRRSPHSCPSWMQWRTTTFPRRPLAPAVVSRRCRKTRLALWCLNRSLHHARNDSPVTAILISVDQCPCQAFDLQGDKGLGIGSTSHAPCFFTPRQKGRTAAETIGDKRRPEQPRRSDKRQSVNSCHGLLTARRLERGQGEGHLAGQPRRSWRRR